MSGTFVPPFTRSHRNSPARMHLSDAPPPLLLRAHAANSHLRAHLARAHISVAPQTPARTSFVRELAPTHARTEAAPLRAGAAPSSHRPARARARTSARASPERAPTRVHLRARPEGAPHARSTCAPPEGAPNRGHLRPCAPSHAHDLRVCIARTSARDCPERSARARSLPQLYYIVRPEAAPTRVPRARTDPGAPPPKGLPDQKKIKLAANYQPPPPAKAV